MANIKFFFHIRHNHPGNDCSYGRFYGAYVILLKSLVLHDSENRVHTLSFYVFGSFQINDNSHEMEQMETNFL